MAELVIFLWQLVLGTVEKEGLLVSMPEKLRTPSVLPVVMSLLDRGILLPRLPDPSFLTLLIPELVESLVKSQLPQELLLMETQDRFLFSLVMQEAVGAETFVFEWVKVILVTEEMFFFLQEKLQVLLLVEELLSSLEVKEVVFLLLTVDQVVKSK
jgi:hypothetical protein